MIVKILIILAVILAESGIHWYIIEKKKRDPKRDFVFKSLRTLILLSVGVAMAGAAYSWDWQDIYPTFAWVGYIVVVRWALFDYFLNIARKKPLFYLGNVTIDDRIERKINGWVLLAIKGTMYFVSTSLIMLL